MNLKQSINILGMGIGRDLAPYDNCWGVNSVIFHRPVDIMFDMHDEDLMNEHQVSRRRLVMACAYKMGVPVYSCREIPGTTYVRYPIEQIISKFKTAFFSNAICYMIALAIYEGVKQINFYGVNHSKNNLMGDYIKNKPGVDFWLGMCHGYGVEYNIFGDDAEIGKTYTGKAYGYLLDQKEMLTKYGQLP